MEKCVTNLKIIRVVTIDALDNPRKTSASAKKFKEKTFGGNKN